MANRRMFSMDIVDSDAFLDMPLSTQCLYFQLGMRADDDGFISNPKMIIRMLGCSNDDMNILISKKFVYAFDNGIVVIKHWNINNSIRKDRYHKTNYIQEKKQLLLESNGAYTKLDGIPFDNQVTTNCQPSDDQLSYQMETEVRLGKDRLGYIKDIVEKTIEYLNKKTGKNFRSSSKKNSACIKARINEGYELKDFMKVIDTKCKDWLNDPKMEKYLRPETLFSNKFEGYLNQGSTVMAGGYESGTSW